MKRAIHILLALALLGGAARAQDAAAGSLVLVLDVSKSLGPQFAEMKMAAAEVIRRRGEGVEVMIVTFAASSDIRVAQDFTADAGALLAALDGLHTREGQSAVTDALYLAAGELAKRATGRRGVIVITDGDERASYHKPAALDKALADSRARVYAVGFVNGLRGGARRKAVKYLDRVTRESGGRSFYVESAAELPGVASSIAVSFGGKGGGN